MIKKIICFVFISTTAYSQNTGFLGKKNIVDLNIGVYMPLLSYLYGANTPYKNEKGKLIQKYDYLDFSYNVNYFRAIDEKFSFGIELGFQRLDIAAPTSFYRGNYYSENYVGEFESMKYKHYVFIPKLEFNSRNGIFGTGFHNQIGFGFCKTKLMNLDYIFDLSDYSNWGGSLTPEQEEEFKTNFYNFQNDKGVGNCILLYAINFRKNITKRFMLNYGFRYTLNFFFRTKNWMYNNQYWLSQENVNDMIHTDRASNFIQFRFGASYVF